MTNRERINNPTFRDLIEAMRTINKFVQFGEKVGELMRTLYRAGVDIRRINPYDISSLIQLARSTDIGEEFDEEKLEELISEFEDIIDTPISEIENSLRIMSKYMQVMKSAERQLKRVTERMGMRMDEINALAEMFGIKLPHRSKQTVEELDYEEDYVEGMTEEEVEELKKIIEDFKKSK